jgi:hypothetical protein
MSATNSQVPHGSTNDGTTTSISSPISSPTLTHLSNGEKSTSIPAAGHAPGIPATTAPSASGNIPNKNSSFVFALDTPSLSSGTLDKYLKNVLGNDSAAAIPDLLKPQEAQQGFSSPSQNDPLTKESSGVDTAPKVVSVTSTPLNATLSASSDVSMPPPEPSITNQLATTEQSNEIIPMPRGQSYVDITEYLNMPQADAARKLNIPPSTLSKRWKEAVRKRKWPYRMICKIDKEIMTLLHNVPQGAHAPPLPEEIEGALGILLRKRQDELRPVVIRI